MTYEECTAARRRARMKALNADPERNPLVLLTPQERAAAKHSPAWHRQSPPNDPNTTERTHDRNHRRH